MKKLDICTRFTYPLKVSMQVKNAMQCKNGLKMIGIAVFLIAISFSGFAQNSPYSQRGLGNSVRAHNVLNTAMGGISEAYADGQTINFNNPASYADLRLTTLDVGFNAGYLNIRDQDTSSFRSGFGSLSYIQLGFPLKKGGGWGLVFGLTPETKVNYRIARADSLTGIGVPVSYLYEGQGGAYKAYFGTGYAIKGFRFGVNAGYLFGSRQTSTQSVYPKDSLGLFNSNSRSRTGYGAFFWDAGIQAHIKLGKDLGLELGASGGLQTKLNGKRDYLVETFNYTGDPSDQSPKNQDTVYYENGKKGTIIYPAHYGFGFLLHSSKGEGSWSFGADYQTTQWSDFKSYDSTGNLRDSRTLRLGIQFIPSTNPSNSSYWQMVAYRAGFYTTQENFKSNNSGITEYAFSLGFGFPIRNFMRSNQFTLLNTAIEIGKRGNKSNLLNERFFKVSIGFTLSDIWFIEKRYQ